MRFVNGVLNIIGDTGVTKGAMAAMRGAVTIMLWVDHDSYFGPDRRRKAAGMRMRERRRYDLAGLPPSLPIALRQLRMRVLDARGPAAVRFADRAQATALLAQMNDEYEASDELSSLAMTAARGAERDVRPTLYDSLDRTHTVLRTLQH